MGEVATKVIASFHKADPREVIWRSLDGLLDKVEPTGSDLLICVYERPTIIRMKDALGRDVEFDTSATSRVKEDKFQGTVGLIVKIGPLASEHAGNFKDEKMPQIGDWVSVQVGTCISFTLGERMMRLVQANFVRLTLTDPDCII